MKLNLKNSIGLFVATLFFFIFFQNCSFSKFNSNSGLIVANSLDSDSQSFTEQKPIKNYKNFQIGYFSLKGSEVVQVDNVILRISLTGALEIIDQNQNILWSNNFSGDCSKSSDCSLIFQGDGNLVFYTKGAVAWSSGTWNNAGAYLTVSAQKPYFTISNGNAEVIWPKNITSPPLSLTQSSIKSDEAISVYNFKNRIAVNMHVVQNGFSASTILKMLTYLGVWHVRDEWVGTDSLLEIFRQLGLSGVKFSMLTSDLHNQNNINQLQKIITTTGNSLHAIEGPNEINNFKFVCDDVQSVTGWPNNNGPLAQKFMNKMYSQVKSNSDMNSILVYDLTWGGTVDAGKYGFFNLNNKADRGNIHIYPSGQPYKNLQAALPSTYTNTLPHESVITEAGYDTANMTERAQAILTLNLIFSSAQQGFDKLYLYELYDEWQTYGLFKKDFNPKLAATAIHNLTTILKDSQNKNFKNKINFSYSLKNLPTNGHTLMVQSSSGSYYLIVWNEEPVVKDKMDIQVASNDIELTIDRPMANVNIYSPMVSSEAIGKLSSVNKINFRIAAEPIIIEFN